MGDWHLNMTCEEFCVELTDDETMTVTLLVSEDNDGLLARASNNWMAPKRTTWRKPIISGKQDRRKQVVLDAFEDLFKRGGGCVQGAHTATVVYISVH